MDWRDALDRLKASRPSRVADELVDQLQPGQALILVQPILRAYYAGARRGRRRSRSGRSSGSACCGRISDYGASTPSRASSLSQPPRGVRVVLYRRK